MQDLLAQVVEHHDVSVHVEQVICVRRVVIHSPCLRLWTFVREHVVTVFGLIIHAVKSCYLLMLAACLKNTSGWILFSVSKRLVLFLRGGD